jgi:Cof subfamily protein (haloacid dehalogenase superfamily)
MTKPPIQLLALDLDGTITADFGSIPPENAAAIAQVQARGVTVTIATGREYNATLPFARQLNITTPLICYQGGLIRHPQTEEIFLQASIPLVFSRRIIKYAREHKMHMMMYLPDQVLTEYPSDFMLKVTAAINNPVTVVNNLLAALNDETPPIKFLILTTAAQADANGRQLQEAFGDSLTVVKSHETIVELIQPGVSKGVALRHLAELLNIPLSAVMTVGDQDNDVEMLQAAGLGVAMGNASPAAKAAADVVAPPLKEGGLVWALQTYILEQE